MSCPLEPVLSAVEVSGHHPLVMHCRPERSDIRDLGLQPLSGVRFEGAGSSEVSAEQNLETENK